MSIPAKVHTSSAVRYTAKKNRCAKDFSILVYMCVDAKHFNIINSTPAVESIDVKSHQRSEQRRGEHGCKKKHKLKRKK